MVAIERYGSWAIIAGASEGAGLSTAPRTMRIEGVSAGTRATFGLDEGPPV